MRTNKPTNPNPLLSLKMTFHLVTKLYKKNANYCNITTSIIYYLNKNDNFCLFFFF